MRGVKWTIALLALACGPSVAVPPGGGDTEGGTGTGDGGDASASASSTAAPDTTGTPPGSDGDGGSTGDPGATGSSSTGGPPELVPPESVDTAVTCNDDATIQLYIEVYLGEPTDGCAPPPDADIDEILLVVVSDWNGLPGVIEVGPDGPAKAASTEELTGTLTVEVWAPTHPSFATVDLAGPTTAFYGVVDLQNCVTANEAPCDLPPDGGG